MVRRVLSVIAVVCGLGGASPASAAMLLIDANGILTGANGVDIGGTPYDVRFRDDSCIAIFAGCDEESDLDFPDAAAATLAGQALLGQVLINQFDTDPSLIAGCASVEQCVVFIPSDLDVGQFPLANGVSVTNNGTAFPFGGDVDQIGPLSVFRVFSTATNQFSVYADFSPAAAAQPVPEPASLILLGSGLAGLATRMRTHRRSRRG